MLESMEIALGKKGYDIRTFRDGAAALDEIKAAGADVLVVDLKMPGMDGLALLRATRDLEQDLVVVMMTAHSTIGTAVEAMKAGAYDYVPKPFDVDELDMIMRRAVEERRLRRQQVYVARTQRADVAERRLIGQSEKIARIHEMIGQVAPSDSTVLIQGESGTGKELVARHIHRASPRKDQLFIPVNVAAIPEPLLESELFGHAKGAFTSADRAHKGLFEVADGGTLFLDEISETSPPLQAKLLRAIEEKEIRSVGSSHPAHVDVRLIASTNVDLLEAVGSGRFREDLFYRLNVFPITLPSLRERKEDVPLLAQHFLRRCCVRLRKDIRAVSPEALKILQRYDWPGNVRELENVIERAVIVEEGAELGPSSLFLTEVTVSRKRGMLDGLLDMQFHEAKALFEKLYIEGRLRAGRSDSMTALANQLGIHRTTLYELIQRHGINQEEL